MAKIIGTHSGGTVGDIINYTTNILPSYALACNGLAVSRATYSVLFSTIAISTTASTNATTTISGMTSTSFIDIGNPVSGTNIPAGATVASIVNANSITISAAATGTTVGGSLVIAPYGIGDGSTTFNVPNAQGVHLRSSGSQVIGGNTYSGTVGTTQGDQFQGHKHTDSGHSHTEGFAGVNSNASFGVTTVGTAGNLNAQSGVDVNNHPQTSPSVANISGPTTDGTNGTPRTGAETRPANLGVNRCIVWK